ncbi:uncharacterized protein MKZ38_002093 [Zalerion maritima]|uniref:GH16 domain-containing protein n=1 Tax=Zalerion maritima TaxID=339359 RepID=A0AAD5WTD3_9PEZI|nr:uncharacterized protein MKZ38_002093 [Zalerion maritima]
MRFTTSAILAILSALGSAVTPPSIDGYSIVWKEEFWGGAGDSVSSSNWDAVLGINTNNDIQTYTDSNSNVQISGGGTLQLVPQKSDAGIWTSARLESTGSWTPAAGKTTRAQGNIRFGSNSQSTKQGMWPAFWMLGDSIRSGTGWPMCGELDLMETVNGLPTAYGTAHCGTYPGGVCNEPTGKGNAVALNDYDWHTWSMEWDRTSNNWSSETITWYLDGNQFHQITGSGVGDEAIWGTLAHSPMYFILNIAIGGDWPGNPNDATVGGYGAMMEVAYVAVYQK